MALTVFATPFAQIDKKGEDLTGPSAGPSGDSGLPRRLSRKQEKAPEGQEPRGEPVSSTGAAAEIGGEEHPSSSLGVGQGHHVGTNGAGDDDHEEAGPAPIEVSSPMPGPAETSAKDEPVLSPPTTTAPNNATGGGGLMSRFKELIQ